MADDPRNLIGLLSRACFFMRVVSLVSLSSTLVSCLLFLSLFRPMSDAQTDDWQAWLGTVQSWLDLDPSVRRSV